MTTSVNLRRLKRVGARPSFLDYLVSLWDYRHFIYYDAKARVRTGNEQDKLGSAWLILSPLLNGLMFYFVMGILLHSGGKIKNFVAYLIIGVFLFQFTTRSINASSRAISSNRNVIHAFKFPRATLVIATNVRELLSNVPVIVTMLILIIILPPNEQISMRWLLLIPIIGLQLIFNLGFGLIMARLAARFNDANHILSYGMRAWMYLSCMFFSIDRFAGMPVVKSIMEHNPLYQVLFMARETLIYNATPSWRSWTILALWAFSMLAIGAIFFWKAEESYGREL
ncbi:ABC transporter permease [Arthrobacter livingstonensis]|uniref:ABC transporter permease n=1 Tax=Arthrobacter livingstonensis TaxID=670078 RepID=UPI001FE31124|nr:ABC transporter permease [Arthrobacter livingstonensis]